jgi:hypothetical protein
MRAITEAKTMVDALAFDPVLREQVASAPSRLCGSPAWRSRGNGDNIGRLKDLLRDESPPSNSYAM